MNNKHYHKIEDKKAKHPLVGYQPATLQSMIRCVKQLFQSRSFSFYHPGTVAEWQDVCIGNQLSHFPGLEQSTDLYSSKQQHLTAQITALRYQCTQRVSSCLPSDFFVCFLRRGPSFIFVDFQSWDKKPARTSFLIFVYGVTAKLIVEHFLQLSRVRHKKMSSCRGCIV